MAKKITLIYVPDHSRSTRQWRIPSYIINALPAVFCLNLAFGVFGLWQWGINRDLSKRHELVVMENRLLRGEAKLLESNLEEVNKTLAQINDYTIKLDELMNKHVRHLGNKIGLTELSYSKKVQEPRLAQMSLPLGLNPSRLSLKPLFSKLTAIDTRSTVQISQLDEVIGKVKEHSSILASIPLIKPVAGFLASGFGLRKSPFSGIPKPHEGIDLAAPPGTTIYAPADGKVIFSGKKDGYGNLIVLSHGRGIQTLYGHNAKNFVQVGQKILRGVAIAEVGLTGRTTGPHLHYEILINGKSVNPLTFMLN